jgi:hypothetical protein
VDDDKIKWLQANRKLFDFTLIDQQDYSPGNKIYIYTMKKFDKLYKKGMSDYNKKRVYEDVIIKYNVLRNKKGFDGVQVKDLDFIMYDIDDLEIKDILKKLKKTFPSNKQLDLHGGQWGEDENGNLVLFDPVFSTKVVNKMEDFNDLGLGTKLSIFLSELFDKSKSQEIKTVKKLIEK